MWGCAGEARCVRDASQVQLVDPLGLGVVPLREPRQLLRQRLQDAAEERGQRRRDGVHQLPHDAGAAAAHAARELLDARDVDVHLYGEAGCEVWGLGRDPIGDRCVMLMFTATIAAHSAKSSTTWMERKPHWRSVRFRFSAGFRAFISFRHVT